MSCAVLQVNVYVDGGFLHFHARARLHSYTILCYILFYSSTNVIGVTKMRGKKWAVHRTRKEEMHITFMLGSFNQRDYVKDLGVDDRILWKCILRKKNVRL